MRCSDYFIGISGTIGFGWMAENAIFTLIQINQAIIWTKFD